MKLGILGGSFNPIHTGHLLVAEQVRVCYSLDKVYFIPANIPPHKEFIPQIPDKKRLKLIELAIESNPNFELSDIEIQRGGVSYTIDTIRQLYNRLEIEGRIFLLIGGDLIKDITTWKEHTELIDRVNLVVINRDNYKADHHLTEFPFILTVDSIDFSVTSTLIRERILKGKSIKYLVPEKVEDYITTHKLYSTTKTNDII